MSISLDAGSGGATLLTDQVDGVDAEVVKLGYSPSGTAPTQVSLTNPLPVQSQPIALTSGGPSYTFLIAPATPAVETAKSTAGNVVQVLAFNILSTPVYLKMFDVSGTITLGTTSATYEIPIPGNTGAAGFAVTFAQGGRSHANSIKYTVTNAIGLTDDTAITANSVTVDISYN